MLLWIRAIRIVLNDMLKSMLEDLTAIGKSWRKRHIGWHGQRTLVRNQKGPLNMWMVFEYVRLSDLGDILHPDGGGEAE